MREGVPIATTREARGNAYRSRACKCCRSVELDGPVFQKLLVCVCNSGGLLDQAVRSTAVELPQFVSRPISASNMTSQHTNGGQPGSALADLVSGHDAVLNSPHPTITASAVQIDSAVGRLVTPILKRRKPGATRPAGLSVNLSASPNNSTDRKHVRFQVAIACTSLPRLTRFSCHEQRRCSEIAGSSLECNV